LNPADGFLLTGHGRQRAPRCSLARATVVLRWPQCYKANRR